MFSSPDDQPNVPASKQHTIDDLCQVDLHTQFVSAIGRQLWQTIYRRQRDLIEGQSLEVFCALLKKEALEIAVQEDRWDLALERSTEAMVAYLAQRPPLRQQIPPWVRAHFPQDFGLRALLFVHEQDDGVRIGFLPDFEKSMRLFRRNSTQAGWKRALVARKDREGESEVARYNADQADIRLDFVQRFMSMRQLCLGIYFESLRLSRVSLEDLPSTQLQQAFFEVSPRRLVRYTLSMCPLQTVVDRPTSYAFSTEQIWQLTPTFEAALATGSRTLSHVFGKVILAPPAIDLEQLYLWVNPED